MMHDDDHHSGDQTDASDNGVDPPEQPSISLTPMAGARRAMTLVCILLAGFAILAFGAFAYQTWRRLELNDPFFRPSLRWVSIFGYLVRGAGLALMGWRLAQYIHSHESKADGPADTPAARYRVFWNTFAWVFVLVSSYAGFQIAYNSWQDRVEVEEGAFQPEFQSGRVAFRKERIDIRRGFAAPMPGLQKMQKKDLEEFLFVAGDSEITGRDIADSTIEIAEVFPGHQRVSLTIKFTDEGTRKIEKLTREHQTQALAVLIDGELRANPRVFSVISRDAQLSGVLTLEEAAKIIENGGDQ
jgi:hypothetical protein